MRPRPTGLASGIAIALALGPLGSSRAQEQVPGTRAELVQLDVIVTDADGKPVRGLTRDDFLVLEDKKEQRLASFVVVQARAPEAGSTPAATGSAPAAPGEGQPPPAAGPVSEPVASAPDRHLVIVIDDLHIAAGNLEFVKGALSRLVDEFVGPNDSIALLTTSGPGGSQQLSRDKARLKQAIGQLSAREALQPPAAGTQMTPVQAELILRGDVSARRLAGQKLLDEPGSVYSAQSPRAATEQGSTAASQAGAGSTREAQEAVAEREAVRQARAVLDDALRYSAATLRTIEDVLRSLAPLPGRKLCLLVSDGFLVGTGTSEERTKDLRAIIDAATRSGAVVYAIDSRGLVGAGGEASNAASVASAGLEMSVDRTSTQLFRMTLESISADTGGFLVSGTNAFDTGIRRMLSENDGYYLMAYEPANKKRDGKFRRIEVKLPKHASYLVRTRRGYLAADDSKPAVQQARAQPPLPPPQPHRIEEAEARTIIDTAMHETGLPVRMAADFVDAPPDGSIAIVNAHVEVAALAAESAGPFAVDFLGGVYDAAGKPIGPAFGRRSEVSADGAARARKDGLPFQQRLALPPGRYEIRLAARDSAMSRLGGASQWVEIPDLKAGALTLSAVFLSSSTPKPAGPGAAAGEELRDVQVLRRFSSKDSLYFQIYAYNLREEGGAADAVLQAQLRQGETLVAASQPQPIRAERRNGALLPLTNGMPLGGLPAGRYDLRVVVMDKKANVTVSRQVDFTIE